MELLNQRLMEAGVVVTQVVCVGAGMKLLGIVDDVPALDVHRLMGALRPLHADAFRQRSHLELQLAVIARQLAASGSAYRSSFGFVFHGLSLGFSARL